MSEFNQDFKQLLINWMGKSDDNHKRIFIKLDEQGKTLARLTTTVELHQKYSENLEKEQKANRAEIRSAKEELDNVDKELSKKIDNVVDHIKEVKVWMQIFKPTKTKAAAGLVLITLMGGGDVLKSKAVQELIKSYFGVQIQTIKSENDASAPK